MLPLEDMEVTLLDTPGHVDFSAEMERTLQVLDCAVLVISGTDGVQGHTLTLWRLLERYQDPHVSVRQQNGPARGGPGRAAGQLQAPAGQRLRRLLRDRDELFWRRRPLCDEDAAGATIWTRGRPGRRRPCRRLIAERKLFPCCFGSALKLEGVEELLDGLDAVHAASRPIRRTSAPGCSRSARDDQGDAADLAEGHRRHAAGARQPAPAARRDGRLGGEGQTRSASYSGAKFTAGGGGPGGDGVRRHRPDATPCPGRAWGPRRERDAPGAGAGAHLSGACCRRAATPTPPLRQAAAAGGGGSPAPAAVERAAAERSTSS